MKTLLDEIILKLDARKNGYCRITHLKGWREYLEDGDMVFTPHDLHESLLQIINRNPPRGEMLLYPRKKNNFTVISGDKPGKPEEALERFITLSNPGNYYNQFPLRGRRESSDIAILNNVSKHVLIELKPWHSNNSPLYALIESLKNLITYRTFRVKNINYHRNFIHFNEADLNLLAPMSYYQDYCLIDSSGSPILSNVQVVKTSLDDLSAEFKSDITFLVLPLEESLFYERCRKACDKYKMTNRKETIYIREEDAMPELKRDKWQLLVSSNRDIS